MQLIFWMSYVKMITMMKIRRDLWLRWLITIVLAFFLTACANQSQPSSGIVDGEMEVHFLDVGQGDCTLVVCDGRAMLVDAGDNDKGSVVQRYLEGQGIEGLDYVIGTHPDADHIGGLDVVLHKFDCETVMMPEGDKDTRTYDEVVQTMENKSYELTKPEVGDSYTLGSAEFTMVAPNGDYGGDANEGSIGILLSHGDNQFMLAGDAEGQAEEDMVENGIDISADVYKVSHHGSQTASTREFLEAVDPTYAVISCGEGNPYGHPHARTLNALQSMGTELFRTDEQGGIVATSDGEEITWNQPPTETWQAGAGSETDEDVVVGDEAKVNEGNVDPGEAEGEAVSGEATYIVNTNTGKFHIPSCSSIDDMKEENALETTWSREEVVGQGYSPCGRCKP